MRHEEKMMFRLYGHQSYKILLIVAAVVLTSVVISRFTQAASPTLALSPVTQNVTKDTTFTVQVRMSSETPVTAIHANLNYSPNLEVANVDYAGSAFGLEVQNTYGNGTLRLARASLTPVNGDALFALITFRAVGGGSALVTFGAGSDMASAIDDSNILGATLNGRYKITGKK